MKEGLVTVIVPVYNAESTLTRCLSSIAEQSYTSLQVIVVDDGSEDTSASICDRFAQLDDRFIAVHTQNQGVCAARNVALSMRKGEYISFVDSDDCIHPRMIETMLSELNKLNADLIFCNVAYVCGRPVIDEARPLNLKVTQLKTENFLRCVFSLKKYNCYGQNGGYLCNKLFRASVIKETKLIASKVAEDELFLVSIAHNLRKIIFVDEALYFYVVREQSLSHRKDFTFQLVRAREIAYKTLAATVDVRNMCAYGYAMSLVWFFDELNFGKKFLYYQNMTNRDDLRKRVREVMVKLIFNPKLTAEYLSLRDFTKLFFSALPFSLQYLIYKIKNV